MEPSATSARGVFLGISIVGALLARRSAIGCSRRAVLSRTPRRTRSARSCWRSSRSGSRPARRRPLTTGRRRRRASRWRRFSRAPWTRCCGAAGARATLERYWTPGAASVLGITTLGPPPPPRSTALDIWVPNTRRQPVSRVRASDGTLLGTWTGRRRLRGSSRLAGGKIFVTGESSPGESSTGSIRGSRPAPRRWSRAPGREPRTGSRSTASGSGRRASRGPSRSSPRRRRFPGPSRPSPRASSIRSARSSTGRTSGWPTSAPGPSSSSTRTARSSRRSRSAGANGP